MPNRWVVDLEVYSKLSTVFSLWTCARNRFGFQLNDARFRINMNTHNVYFNQQRHVQQNYQRLAEAMGAEVKDSYPFPKFSAVDRKARPSFQYIALNNTCSDLSPERKMPIGLWIETLSWLLKNSEYQLLILGAPSDFTYQEKLLQEHFPKEERIHNVSGKLSFETYYETLHKECALLITIDSAPLHIGAKLGLPVLSLWGPTSPENLGHAGHLQRHCYLQVPCSPCVHHTEVLPCGGDNICMKHISLSSITSAYKSLIEEINSVPQ
jgi:ADP-heptose:LPS heptosyltransferase